MGFGGASDGFLGGVEKPVGIGGKWLWGCSQLRGLSGYLWLCAGPSEGEPAVTRSKGFSTV